MTIKYIIPLGALLLGLAGCAEGVDPIIGEERPFTLWGFMDAGADTQRVHVVAIESRLGLDRSGPIDARVVSTNLDTGVQREWRDAETVFPDSSTGHVFWAAFRPVPEHRYRLEVMRSDGAASHVEVQVPRPIDLHLQENAPNQTRVSVFIDGFDLNLVWLQAEYEAFTLPPVHPWPPGSPAIRTVKLSVPVRYNGKAEPAPNGLEIEVDLAADFAHVADRFNVNCLNTDMIGLGRVNFAFLVGNAEWVPPGGVFDPEVLAQPGALSNVENGFGFYGAGFTAKAQWFPSDRVKTDVGYQLQGPCGFMPLDIPACQVPPPPCTAGS